MGPRLVRNNDKVELGGKSYSHDLLAADSLEFVKRNKDRPFFLYLAFTIPHQKLQVPDLGPYADEPWPANLKKVASMVTRMDRDIGRLMSLLKELGLDERTLVFFASDNGAVYTDKRGVTIRVRCAWENTTQGLPKKPLAELVSLTVDGAAVSPTLVSPRQPRGGASADVYHQFHLPEPEQGKHTATARVRLLATGAESIRSVEFSG